MQIRWLFVCLAVSSPAWAHDDKPRVRSYTNEDLDRIHAERADAAATAESQPVVAPRPERERSPARGEAYWRREAERAERRLEPLRRRLQELERKLAEPRPTPRNRRSLDPWSNASHEQLQTQIQALRARIREEETRFADRARREGALPGWLRR